MLEWIKSVVGPRRVTQEEFSALEQYYNTVCQVSAAAVAHAFTNQVRLHGIEGRVFRDARLDN
jgi:hypothetical protein